MTIETKDKRTHLQKFSCLQEKIAAWDKECLDRCEAQCPNRQDANWCHNCYMKWFVSYSVEAVDFSPEPLKQ